MTIVDADQILVMQQGRIVERSGMRLLARGAQMWAGSGPRKPSCLTGRPAQRRPRSKAAARPKPRSIGAPPPPPREP
jgi:hypothetical protein